MALHCKSISALFSFFLLVSVQADNTRLLLKIMNIEQQMMGGFEAMKPIIEQQSAQLNLSDEKQVEFMQAYKDWFAEDLDRQAMMDEFAQLYESEFTPDEIEEMIQFYQTPLGQKMLRKTPLLTKRGAEIGMKAGQEKQHLLMQRLQPFLTPAAPPVGE